MLCLLGALLLGGALLLPWLVDSQLVKEKISSILAEKTQGKVTLGKIDLLWFPLPAVTVADTALVFDEKTQGTIRTARVYPSIINLFMGRVVLRRVQLEGPRVKVHLDAPVQQPLDVDELEKSLGAVFTYLTTELSGLRIDLSDGAAEIEIGGGRGVMLQDLNAEALASSEKILLKLSVRSNLFDGFRVEGEIAQATLAAKFAAKVAKLRLKEARAVLAQNLLEYLEDGELNLGLEVDALGLKRINAEIDGAPGYLVLKRRDGKVHVNAKRLKAKLVYDQGTIQTTVEHLELARPRVKASGELRIQPKASSARIRLRDLDVAEIRAAALQIASDVPAVKTLFEVVKAGTVPEIVFQSGGSSLAEMKKSKNIIVAGTMRDGGLFIPNPGLDLQNVSGSVRIAAGVLEGKDLGAKLGTAKGWDGKLRMGLEGKTAPFHLNVAVQTKAAELQSVLLKLDVDETLHREFAKLRHVTGDMSGRLILGERLDALTPEISVSNADITAAYDPVPYSIAIKGGYFKYERGTIVLENLAGSIGKSTVAGLNATLYNDRSRRIQIASGRFSLDLEQLHAWLRGTSNLRTHLAKLHSTGGRVELAHLTLEGIVDDPANWQFTGAGSLRQVVIAHADAPSPITLAQGKFTVTREKVAFSETSVRMLDGALTVGGVVERSKGFPPSVKADGTGTLRGKVIRWLSGQAELPKELLVRSPVRIAAGHFDWRGAGDFSFRGRVTVAGGPQIDLDAARDGERVVVRNLTVEDGARRADFKANLLKDSLDLSFKGVLTQLTLDKIFASFPFQGSLLEGDIEVLAALKEPVRFSARGYVQGNNFSIALRQGKVRVEKFRIEGLGRSLRIRSANLRWRDSRVALSGTVAEGEKRLTLDMDVSADNLDWDELSRFNGSEKDQGKDNRTGAAWLNSLQGTIRLKAEKFKFESYNISPLRMTAALTPSGIRADVTDSVACGIKAAGQIDVRGREIGLDIGLTATEAELEPTVLCLTDKRSDVKGMYSMTARITGRGDRESLLHSVKGDFEISARDGEFVRSSAADATFDYLNGTGDFKVAFPDLDKETFPFRLLSVKGRIDGDTLISDEVIIQATTLTITGQGKVDLRRRQTDAKGLISVAMPANQLIKYIPLIGPLVGGRLIGIPVRIFGSLDRPDVQYLAPADVGMELVKMPLRVLGAPLEAIKIFTPRGKAQEKTVPKETQ